MRHIADTVILTSPERLDDTTSINAAAPLALVRPWAVTRVLLCIASWLVVASVAGQTAKYEWGIARAGGLISAFHLDQEGNFPTWYQSALLLAASGLLAAVAAMTRRTGGRFAGYWQLLAVLVLGCSVDEVAGVHEWLIPPLRALLDAQGIWYFTWVVPGTIFITLLAVGYARFFHALYRERSILLLLSGALYVAGALGMEYVNGAFASRHGTAHLTYAYLTTVEESLEMFGVILLNHALLTRLAALPRALARR